MERVLTVVVPPVGWNAPQKEKAQKKKKGSASLRQGKQGDLRVLLRVAAGGIPHVHVCLVSGCSTWRVAAIFCQLSSETSRRYIVTHFLQCLSL